MQICKLYNLNMFRGILYNSIILGAKFLKLNAEEEEVKEHIMGYLLDNYLLPTYKDLNTIYNLSLLLKLN